jgi:hypothetical protein
MANYYTSTSFLVQGPTKESTKELLELFTKRDEASCEDDDILSTGCIVQLDRDTYSDGPFVWITHDESANVEAIAEVLSEWLESPEDRPAFVAFEYAFTASRPLLDAFGGGACYVSRTEVKFTTTGQWIEDQK